MPPSPPRVAASLSYQKVRPVSAGQRRQRRIIAWALIVAGAAVVCFAGAVLIEISSPTTRIPLVRLYSASGTGIRVAIALLLGLPFVAAGSWLLRRSRGVA